MSWRLRLERVVDRAGAAVDRGGMRLVQRAMAAGGGRRRSSRPAQRMAELAAHYRAADLFAPPPAAELAIARAAPRAGAAAVLELSWPSRYRASYPGYHEELARYGANGIARARLYLGARDEAPRPTVICVHGWGAGQPWLDERAFSVRTLLEMGVDVALFQLPFHGERAPVQAQRSGSLFLTSHLVRTNEALGQAIHDIRALRAGLLAQGAPAAGALGMSLGAYVTALWAGVDAELDFAGALIPAVSMSELWWSHADGGPERRRAERDGVSQALLAEVFAIHAPLARAVSLPRERLFIAAARGDGITPPHHAESLWRHWGEPAIVWMAGGHLAQLERAAAFRALRRWLYSLGLASR